MKINARGFSLIEVLVAIGISTIVAGAMYALIENALGSSNYFTDRQEHDEAVRQAQFILLRDSNCAESIRAPGDQPVQFTGNPVNIERIKSWVSPTQETVLLQSNQAYGRIRIGNMTISEATSGTQRPPPQIIYENGTPVAHDTYFVNLTIPANSRTGKAMNPRQIPLKIYVRQPDPANPAVSPVIRRCHIRHADNQMCGSFGGTFNEATGVCDMRPCRPDTVDDPCPAPPAGWACTAPAYFWGFANDTIASPVKLGPRCVCTQSCQPPPPPPPTPTGPAGGTRGY